eukprot:924599-Ditylum_brightwellii.AAC.1
MGVLTHLGRLTSREKELYDVDINQIYPKHAAAIEAADLVQEKYPTLGEVWQSDDSALANQRKTKKDN